MEESRQTDAPREDVYVGVRAALRMVNTSCSIGGTGMSEGRPPWSKK